MRRLQEAGGALSGELTSTDSGREQKLGFPWRGYGYAWTSRMEGEVSGFPVLLEVTRVGRDRVLAFFPYVGYGFAWAMRMEGTIAGNPVRLSASEVRREKKLGFPWRGYGYAWTQKMAGDCGKRILIELECSEVGRASKWTFPYQGYGFGWMRKAVLTMALVPARSTALGAAR